jgi:hypothetical protein
MHLDIVALFGIVGSVASFVGLLLPGTGWRQRVIHVIYGFAVTLLAGGFIYYRVQLTETRQIEVEAQNLLKTADLSTDASSRGFMLASVGFLEKYRTRFPETFKLALSLCNNVGVTVSDQDDALQRLHQTWRLSDGAGAMKQLIGGIAGGGLH